MAKNGLDKWFAQKWVDIGSKKKDGSFAKCGRSKQKADAKRKYPKCVPLAKARRMGMMKCEKEIDNHQKLKSISDLQSLGQG